MAALFSDDEPNITREVVMSCVDHSLGYVDWRILTEQFEGYDVKGHVLGRVLFLDFKRVSYFKYDWYKIKLLVQELSEIENGFQIFYNCLRDTQDICHGHLILADDLEMEARSEIITWVATGIPSNQPHGMGHHGVLACFFRQVFS